MKKLSDTPQGPDWFKASDDKWYPPQGETAPAPKKKGGCLKFALIALGLLVVLGIVAMATGGGDDDGGDSGSDGDGADTALFAGRPDVKAGDKERNIGESAELSGYTVTVTNASFQQELSVIEKDGYLVADVTLNNRDDRAQPYNTFEWKLITPAGTIIDPTLSGERQLGMGDLVQGGTVSGKVIWEVGGAKGDYYVIYDPSDLGSERAVWKVTI